MLKRNLILALSRSNFIQYELICLSRVEIFKVELTRIEKYYNHFAPEIRALIMFGEEDFIIFRPHIFNGGGKS